MTNAGVVVGIESLVGLSGMVLAGATPDKSGGVFAAGVLLGALGLCSVVFDLAELTGSHYGNDPVTDQEKAGRTGPWEMLDRSSVAWRNGRAPVDLADVLGQNGPLATFSARDLFAKKGVEIHTLAQSGGASANLATHLKPGNIIAVLDPQNHVARLRPDTIRYLADILRGQALEAFPGMRVVTRDNLVTLLEASGKKLEECEGECEVDTGRRIGADLVVTGDVHEVGTRIKYSLRAYLTSSGDLLATEVASGSTLDELDDSVRKAGVSLFGSLR